MLENRNFPEMNTNDYDVFMGAKNIMYQTTKEVLKYTPVPFCLRLDPSYCV